MTLAGAVLEQLDGDSIRQWCRQSLESMSDCRDELDALNVFPIADRDTGSNLVRTIAGADETVAELGPGSGSAPDVVAAMARGAVLAAHGNSGIILAQFLLGLAAALASITSDSVSAPQLATALDAGQRAAFEAVSEPVAGTVLTVLTAASAAAHQAAGRASTLSTLVTETVHAARRALAGTTAQLPELSAAGVVDAGGAGALILLEALLAVVDGTVASRREGGQPACETHARHWAPVTQPGRSRFEVQYLLQAEVASIKELRTALSELGDSVSIADAGEKLYAVHAHVADAGAAVEAGLSVGRLRQISITELVEFQEPAAGIKPEYRAELAGRDFIDPDPTEASTGAAVVALVSSPELGHIFRAEGAEVVVAGEATAELLCAALLSCRARRVVLLPNCTHLAELVDGAAAQARGSGIGVAVVPTTSEVQGLAAFAVHDRQRRFDDDVIAMAEAAAATRVAHLAVAEAESITYAGRCSAGDVLGLIDGEVVEIGSDYGRVATGLLRRLIAAGGELVTVLVGADAGADRAAETVQSYVRLRHQFVEVTVFHGGSMQSPLVIGVE